MSSALPQPSLGVLPVQPRGWTHLALRLNEPPSDRSEILPPDLLAMERAGAVDGAIEFFGSQGRIEMFLANPPYESGGRKLAIALEEGYHGGVYSVDEGDAPCPFSLLPATDRLSLVVGRALMPSYHLIDIGGWTHDLPPRTQPPREYDLSTTLYRNLEAWMRVHPDASFLLSLLFHRTGPRSKSLMQALRSPEDKVAMQARGWSSVGPFGLYGMQPPGKGSEPTALDDDYHARFTQRQRAPFLDVEARAAVTLDAAGFADILTGWASSVQWRTRYGLGPLYRFEELRYGLLQNHEDGYRKDLDAFRGHLFLRRRKGYGSLTAREFWKDVPIPWGTHHPSIEYRPSQTGTTQSTRSFPAGGTLGSAPPPSRGLYGASALAGPTPGGRATPVSAGTPHGRAPVSSMLTREEKERRFRELVREARGQRGPPASPAARPASRPDAPPAPVPTPGETVGSPIRMGFNEQDRKPVFFPSNDHHTHLVGGTRTGKSTLTLDLVLGKLRATPWPLVVIDPHGSLVKAIKARLTPEEAQKTIEINPALNLEGGKVAIGMNVLHIEDRDKLSETQMLYAKATIQGDVNYILRSGEGDQTTGARIKRNVGMVTLGMLDIPDTTLYDVHLVMEGKGRTRERARFARKVMNQDVRRYTEETLVHMPPDFLQSSQNKVSLFANPIFRAALCQRGKGVVTMRQLLSENRLILINLDHHEIHPEVARFLGAAYMTMIWLSALRWGSEDRPLYVFADEWVTFASESFGTILPGGGKRGIHLVLISQSLEQIPQGRNNEPNLLREVKGNVDTYISFRTDDETARYLNQFSRLERFGFDYRHFLTLPDHYAALIHGNEYADMRTEFPPHPQVEEVQRKVEEIIHRNTWRYSGPDYSAESPFVVGKPAELDVLETLAKNGPMTQGQLQIMVPQHRTDLWEILDKVERQGFVLKRKDGRFVLVELGLEELWRYGRMTHLKTVPGTWMGAGGPDHDKLIAEVRDYLVARGFKVEPTPDQGPGRSLPDLVHWEGSREVHDEIETKAAHPDQVRQNLEKAEGIPVCFFVPDLEVAGRVLQALKGLTPCQIFVRSGPASFDAFQAEEEQEVIHAIHQLRRDGRTFEVEGHAAVSFQDLQQVLSSKMPYQRLAILLKRMVGATIYEVRPRRPEQGGSLILLSHDFPPIPTDAPRSLPREGISPGCPDNGEDLTIPTLKGTEMPRGDPPTLVNPPKPPASPPARDQGGLAGPLPDASVRPPTSAPDQPNTTPPASPSHLETRIIEKYQNAIRAGKSLDLGDGSRWVPLDLLKDPSVNWQDATWTLLLGDMGFESRRRQVGDRKERLFSHTLAGPAGASDTPVSNPRQTCRADTPV